jgi:hypothetical protein
MIVEIKSPKNPPPPPVRGGSEPINRILFRKRPADRSGK